MPSSLLHKPWLFLRLLLRKEKLKERSYLTIMDNISEGLYQSTINGSFIYCNDAFAKIFGYGGKEELLNSVSNISKELYTNSTQRQELMDRLNNEGKVVGYEATVYKKNKDIIWIRINVAKSIDEYGNSYFEGSVVDITNEKRTHHDLILEKSRTQSLLKYASDIISIIDTSGITMYQSESVERVLGYSQDELIGKNIFELIHPDDLETIKNIFYQRIILDRKNYTETYRFLHKKGHYVYLESEGSNMTNTPGVSGVLVNSRDVTERFIQEQKNEQQKLKLIETNEDLDRLLYSLSHEVRGPIANLIGLIELHKMEYPNEELDSFMEIVNKTTNKLDDFLRKMVDYSFNLRSEIKLQSIDLNTFIKGQICQFNKNYPNKLSIEFNENTEVNIYTDSKRLEIILLNIFQNSVHFLDPSKDNNYLKIELQTNEKSVVLLLKDNGIGIEENSLNRIFERSYRGTNISQGTGMGLFLVKEIATKLECKISLDSKQGLGTTLSLEFPKNAVN
ncbi:MAG: hypothetical protein CFE21_07420 [Bacteroidetes bacterium B1(2017)]|nr:MAG: hypothetical protein CFE21_07420 [Bacteroidetes bacterium B1(2017)]